MEDLDDSGSPTLDNMEEPQGLEDPADPLRPDIEEEHEPNAPIGDPTADPDVLEDDAMEEQAEPDNDPALDIDPDDDSELDELDEAQFDNFDPSAANIVVPGQPVAVDESNVGQLGVHKRKRTEEEERERKKKKKEGRRERVSKRSKKTVDEDEVDAENEIDGKRSRGGRPTKTKRRQQTPENEENMTPEERRARALDRKMEAALQIGKQPKRRGAGIDLADQGEVELEQIRLKMADAAQADNEARKRGEPASYKLKLLPKVTELLNRNTLRSSILDPEINVLEAVRFFLEPADEDAALPNYQIQREMFSILAKLQMTKEALLASGIGKVVDFYTKSKQPQPAIKRMAEKLLQAWMGVVLNKKRSGKNTNIESRHYDPLAASQRAAGQQLDKSAVLAERRRKALAAPVVGNRARVEGGLNTYTIAPVNTMVNPNARPLGGDDLVKKIVARATAKKAGKPTKP